MLPTSGPTTTGQLVHLLWRWYILLTITVAAVLVTRECPRGVAVLLALWLPVGNLGMRRGFAWYSGTPKPLGDWSPADRRPDQRVGIRVLDVLEAATILAVLVTCVLLAPTSDGMRHTREITSQIASDVNTTDVPVVAPSPLLIVTGCQNGPE